MQADNFIQTPEDYIGYNRYAYCRYNPFKFIDPSGEWLLIEHTDINNMGETANPIVCYSRIDEIEAEIAADRADALSAFYSIFGLYGFGGLRRSIGTPGGEASSLGYKGSDILPTAVTGETIKTGQTIMGKDGKQYMKGENGLFYEVGDGNNESESNTTPAAETSFFLTGVTWAWGTGMSVLRLIPEEAFSKVMLKSSTFLSIGAAAYDSGLILADLNTNNIASTILGVGANAGLCVASNYYPLVGIPLSFGYWLGDYFCKESCMGASLVQMGCFYQFGEVPTPWYKK
jgi:hypothetical protein